MAKPPQKLQTIDPDHVPETLCNGMFYLTWSGDLATLTFTHTRPKAAALFGSDNVEDEQIVRARIVMNSSGMGALRDLLTRSIKGSGESPTAGAAGETKH